MVDIVGVAVILGGLVLLFAGAVLSLYGVALLGALVGAGVGSLFGPMLGDALGIDGTIALAGGIIVGLVLGIIIAYAVVKWAIAMLGLIVGTYVGIAAIVPALVEVSWYLEVALAIAIGMLAALLAMVFTKSILIILTSLAGAMLASTAVTLDDLTEAADTVSIDPLTFELVDPLFLGLFIIGVLSQYGLFELGMVTRFVRRLPGAGVITDRGGDTR